MKKYENYPPLELLKQTTKQFPSAWEQMKVFHDTNGRDGIAWPEWCYAPMAAALAVASKGKDTFFMSYEEQIVTVKYAQRIAALAAWRQNKEVFVIDKDIEILLFDQDDDLKVPTQALMNLPYHSFYIQFDNLIFDDDKYHGVFIHLEFDVNNDDRELRLLFLREDGFTLGFPIHIGEETVYDSLQKTIQQGLANSRGTSYEQISRQMFRDKNQQKRLSNFLNKISQVVLYLCASNADIEPNEEQKTTYQKRTKSSAIKDRYAEIRKWDTGARVGSAVRKYRAQSKQNENNQQESNNQNLTERKTHASPRPHIRRGHWHNFWTGQRNIPENRKLVLKWVSPTYIGKMLEESPVVIHNVTSK